VFALSIQRCIDDLGFPFRPAPNNGEVLFAQQLLLHQQSEPACGRGGFCDQNQAARLAVEPVHNRDLTAAGDFECQKLAQFFPQIARLVRLCRVNEKKRRFIDDDVIVGFIDDFELE
jgi:hypothetical protein